MLDFLSMSVNFGSYIRKVRDQKGFSLKKVEAQSGGTITGAYVNQIENNGMLIDDVSLGKLVGLAKGLQISIFELVATAIDEDLEKSHSFTEKVGRIIDPIASIDEEYKNLFLLCTRKLADGFLEFKGKDGVKNLGKPTHVQGEMIGNNKNVSKLKKTGT